MQNTWVSDNAYASVLLWLNLLCPILASLSKNNFNFQYVIGRGGFGKVWRVEYRKTMQVYAMKEMSKARIIAKRSVTSVMSEKKLLEKL